MDNQNSSSTSAPLRPSSMSKFDELCLQLNHNRGKQRIEACKNLILLIPNLQEQQHQQLLNKFSALSHDDDDLDVRLQACHGLRELGLTFDNVDTINEIIDTLNAAFSKMEDHDEITYDPEQSWVIPEIECLTVGKLAAKLSKTERGGKIIMMLNKYLTDSNHHVSHAAQESLDFLSNAKLANK